MPELPMTYREAVALVTEIGDSLGGRQKTAIEKILTYAARGVRPESASMEAVRSASYGAQHFAAAQVELEKGAFEAKLKIDEAVGSAKKHIGQGLVALGGAAHKITETEINEMEKFEGIDGTKKP